MGDRCCLRVCLLSLHCPRRQFDVTVPYQTQFSLSLKSQALNSSECTLWSSIIDFERDSIPATFDAKSTTEDFHPKEELICDLDETLTFWDLRVFNAKNGFSSKGVTLEIDLNELQFGSIGRVQIPIDSLIPNRENDLWLPLSRIAPTDWNAQQMDAAPLHYCHVRLLKRPEIKRKPSILIPDTPRKEAAK